MACDDRQLTQAQREAGYQQQRTGVMQALRPFSGMPTLQNLLDYINRELVPAVRAGRNAVNDVYLQVADQAPSANPLSYYFSESTANADPTAGRIRLNASPQDTATVIRISQSNARLQDVTPWLDVMSGGPTTPLGTVTLIDSINPGRFLRFDLNSMTDQGAYWDLGVTIIEGSHDDPFVEDEAVVLAFIAGVSAAGSTVPVGNLSPVATDTFLGNISGSTQTPSAVPLASVDSTSVTYDGTAHEFRRAALSGAIAASANSNATVFSGIRNNGVATIDRTNINVVSTTSIIGDAGDDAANDEIEFNFQRAALTGAIAATQNSNATRFSGILDNGAAENDRTSLNFLTTTSIIAVVTDDSGNDELEITAQRAALTGAISASQNSNSTLFSGIRSNGSAVADRTNINVVSTTSIIGDAGDDAANDEIEFNFQRAALTGAIAASQNSNSTTFAGILDNGAAENNRTNLNFLSTNDITLSINDDSGNDELEITATLAAGSTQSEGTGGQVTLNAGTKVLAITANITISGFARSGGNVDGDRFWVRCNDGIECTLQHAAGTAANQMSLPYADNMIVPGRGMMEFRYETTWRAVSTGIRSLVERHTRQTSDASFTITPNAETTWLRIQAIGGGGGGGGADAGAEESAAGGGGGAGAHFDIIIPVTSGSITGAVGAGGSGGNTSGTDGSAGGDTTVTYDGTTYTAGGGSGGTGIADGEGAHDTTQFVGIAAEGAGGTLSALPTGSVGSDGGDGFPGMMYALSEALQDHAAAGGHGGSSFYGGGGRGGSIAAGAAAVAGTAGKAPGSGGGGAARVTLSVGATGASGGDGEPGTLVVEEWRGVVPTRSAIS